LFQRCGATRLVTAAVVDAAWTRPTPLDADGMRHLAEGLRRVDDVCERRGLVQVLHPHVGTLVETAADVERALEHTDARWCLDTGHLAIGGLDPLQFARDAGDRVEHVHLKDVDLRVAARVRSGEISLMRAVQTGLFTVLGDGDIPVDEVVLALERAGYSGWYVLEQDIALAAAPPPPPDGPIANVSRCLEYLTSRVAPRIPVSSH
jgi:inosose dehydratase